MNPVTDESHDLRDICNVLLDAGKTYPLTRDEIALLLRHDKICPVSGSREFQDYAPAEGQTLAAVLAFLADFAQEPTSLPPAIFPAYLRRKSVRSRFGLPQIPVSDLRLARAKRSGQRCLTEAQEHLER